MAGYPNDKVCGTCTFSRSNTKCQRTVTYDNGTAASKLPREPPSLPASTADPSGPPADQAPLIALVDARNRDYQKQLNAAAVEEALQRKELERQEAIPCQGLSGNNSPAPQNNSFDPDGRNKTLYDLATAQLKLVVKDGKSYIEVGGQQTELPARTTNSMEDNSCEEVYRGDTQGMQMQYPPTSLRRDGYSSGTSPLEHSILHTLVPLGPSGVAPGADECSRSAPNVIMGYPTGAPIWKDGVDKLPGAGKKGKDMIIPDIGPAGWKLDGKAGGKIPFASIGTGNVKPFSGGTAITLAYFLNAFGEEINAIHVPFPFRGVIIRRYLINEAYERILKPLDLDGLGYNYPSIIHKLYNVYHTEVEMKLASWKQEECQQNGMSSQDYAEWIKYLARLATPPHADAADAALRVYQTPDVHPDLG